MNLTDTKSSTDGALETAAGVQEEASHSLKRRYATDSTTLDSSSHLGYMPRSGEGGMRKRFLELSFHCEDKQTGACIMSQMLFP